MDHLYSWFLEPDIGSEICCFNWEFCTLIQATPLSHALSNVGFYALSDSLNYEMGRAILKIKKCSSKVLFTILEISLNLKTIKYPFTKKQKYF